ANLTVPAVGSISRRMQRPVVVFPQPLSPTRPSTSPGATVNETPSTAFTWPTTRGNRPFLIGKCFLRSRTSSSGSGISGLRDAHGVEPAGGDLVRAPAAGQVAAVEVPDRRVLEAAGLRHGTARMEAAALREARRIGNVPGNHAQTVLAHSQ